MMRGACAAALLLLGSWVRAETASAVDAPDARFKADILLVHAHPDDDSLPASYLARAIHDEGRRVAVAICTDGSGGGNAAGPERGAALGLVRRIEARRALATLGIENLWFLPGRDTPSQDVLLSLASWDHGAVLEELVRIVRLTRPEVVMTWLPRNVAGENHGDHQAAGVVATEAFDLAGDPTAFPSQISASRPPTEGLQPWWPKKLYFFSDAYTTDFLSGRGPEYSLREKSPALAVSYAEAALKEVRPYATQMDGLLPTAAREALDRGDVAAAIDTVLEAGLLTDPLRLMLGRSIVPASVTGDVFESIMPNVTSRTMPPKAPTAPRDAISIELGGSWSFYAAFWKAHGLDSLSGLGPPEQAIRPGRAVQVPLVIHNDTKASVEATVSLVSPLPAGWSERPRSATLTVPAEGQAEVQSFVETPDQPAATFQPLEYEARVAGRPVGRAALRVLVRADTMPQ